MAITEALTPNPFQPRALVADDAITALADSIQHSGLLQPIAVRRAGDGYQIIAGERRWAAAKALGMTHIPVIVRHATDEQMLELALIENIQREDLNAIDRASAYRDLCTRFSLTPEEVARRLGEDRSTVVNYMRILDLPTEIRDLVAAGRLSMGHARCLLGITENARRMQIAESAVDNELSVRALEEIVRREKTRRSEAEGESPATKLARPAHILDLQRRFEQVVKTKVLIREGRRKGTGRIIIDYYSLDDFDRIAAMLAVPEE
ncbi:MAG: ParB/RepB/Spo0J family partition protein [Planctomycetota bacterium]|jgi:ParB family chromosome partitioning protein